jgi:hypothetical protein
MQVWSQRLDCWPHKGGCLSKQTLIIGQFATDVGNARLPAKPVIRARGKRIEKARQQVRAFHRLGAKAQGLHEYYAPRFAC